MEDPVEKCEKILCIISAKLSNKKPDKDHPFGHQRYEYITGLIVSLVILVIGILLMKSSVEKLIAFEVETYNLNTTIITISILVFAILVKCYQSIVYRKNGKLINSTALIATSTDSLNDCISTAAVLLSTIINFFYANAFIDGIMGIIVSIFIIISGFKLIKETISPLLGEAPSKEFIDSISSKVMNYEGVIGIHDLVIHKEKEPTCLESGHIEYEACKRCSYTTYEALEALGHKYITEDVLPSCVDKGYKKHECDRCHDLYYDSYVDPLGHTESEWIIDEEPTTKADGHKYKECIICHEVLEEEVISKLPEEKSPVVIIIVITLAVSVPTSLGIVIIYIKKKSFNIL